MTVVVVTILTMRGSLCTRMKDTTSVHTYGNNYALDMHSE